MGLDPSTVTHLLEMQMLVTAVVAGGWWALYRPLLEQPHYRWWAWGWTAFLVFLAVARYSISAPAESTVTALLQSPAGLMQAACFFLGGEALRRGRDVDDRWQRLLLGTALGLGLVLALAHLPVRDDRVSVTLGTLARSPGMALAFTFCGWQFLRRNSGDSGAAVWITAGGFLLYGLNQLVYSAGAVGEAAALLTGGSAGPLGIGLIFSDVLFLADMAWEAAIGVGALLLLVEEKDRLARTARRSQRQFRALFEESADGIVVADAGRRVQGANPAALEMLGWEEEELTGRPLDALFASEENDPPRVAEIAARGGLTVETSCRTREGTEFPVELTLSAYRIEDRWYIQAIMRDISTRKALMDRLMHRATHHPLTDLPNRHYVNEQLERSLAMMARDQSRPAVLFLDLDQFKSVNDSYGHGVGDDLLVAVADRLRETVRDTELVGHLGGDEFVVLVPWCQGADVLRQLGRRVARALSETYRVQGHELGITASVGGAEARPGDTPDALIRRADRAMYRAKDRPRDGSGVFIHQEGSPSPDGG